VNDVVKVRCYRYEICPSFTVLNDINKNYENCINLSYVSDKETSSPITFLVVDREIPIGTKVLCNVNGAGTGVVVGYFNEVYAVNQTPARLLTLRVKLDKAPAFFKKQKISYHAQKLANEGKLPKNPNGEVDTKSKLFKEWVKCLNVDDVIMFVGDVTIEENKVEISG
jgi:hypothetical protein